MRLGYVIGKDEWNNLKARYLSARLNRQLHLGKTLKVFHRDKDKGSIKAQKTLCDSTNKAIRAMRDKLKKLEDDTKKLETQLNKSMSSLDKWLEHLTTLEQSFGALRSALAGIMNKLKSCRPDDVQGVTGCHMNELANVITQLQFIVKATKQDKKKNAAAANVLKVCNKVDKRCWDDFLHFDDYPGMHKYLKNSMQVVQKACKQSGLI